MDQTTIIDPLTLPRIVGADDPPPDTIEARDLARLQRALAVMLREQHQELVDMLTLMQRATDGEDPLTAAFACMATAETLLFSVGLVHTDALAVHLRRYAVAIAETIASR
jgi:uncharacterized protein YaaW (UPF0174 family)